MKNHNGRERNPNHNGRVKKPLARLLLPACISLALAGNQGAIAADEEDEEEVERVTVTGSHIKRTDYETTSPIVVLDRELINKSGVTSLQELFQKVPSMGAGTFSTTFNSQDNTNNGGAGISLRGLGSDSTLVLLNGRRMNVSPFAKDITTAFIDVNNIPLASVERVEILKDGASALYGSDAIAGVVNIILRKDFDGIEAAISYGNTTDTDVSETRASLVWGSTNDQGNVTVIFDYLERNNLLGADRKFSEDADKTGFKEGVDGRSTAGFPGTFVVPEVFFDPNAPAGASVFRFDPACPDERRSAIPNKCRFNFQPFTTLIPDTERVGLTVLAERELNEKIEFFSEFNISDIKSSAIGAPTPIFEGSDNIFIPIDAEGNPFPIDGLRMRFRTVDAGARVKNVDTGNLRFLLGLRGAIFEDKWNWEVAFHQSRSKGIEIGSSGFIRVDRLQEAVTSGLYKPIGGVPNSQEAIDFVTARTTRLGVSRSRIWDVDFDGTITELPAGPLGAAFGYQHREEKIEDTPDDQFASGLIGGTENTAAFGEREVDSVYGELSIPVLKNLDVSFAVRFEDYSDFGDSTNAQVGVLYQPSKQLKLRASFGTGFRAPSLVELGLGASQESLSIVDKARCVLTGRPDDCDAFERITNLSGNSDLDPEESKSFNIGAVYQVTEGLSISADFWHFEVEDLIKRDTQFLVDSQGLDSSVVVRLPQTSDELANSIPGFISSINDVFFNIGEQETEGVDLDIQWNITTDYGQFNWNANITFVTTFDLQDRPGGEIRDRNGEFGNPQTRWTSAIDWNQNDWGAQARVNFIGEFKDDDDAGLTGTVEEFVTFDASVRYTGLTNTTLTFGGQNLFDEDPPFSASNPGGFEPGTGNPRGQFLYFRIAHRF